MQHPVLIHPLRENSSLSVKTRANYQQLTGHHISDSLSNFRHRRTETVR